MQAGCCLIGFISQSHCPDNDKQGYADAKKTFWQLIECKSGNNPGDDG